MVYRAMHERTVWRYTLIYKRLSYSLTWPKQHLYKVRASVPFHTICFEISINILINVFSACSGRQIYNAQKLTIVNVRTSAVSCAQNEKSVDSSSFRANGPADFI